MGRPRVTQPFQKVGKGWKRTKRLKRLEKVRRLEKVITHTHTRARGTLMPCTGNPPRHPQAGAARLQRVAAVSELAVRQQEIERRWRACMLTAANAGHNATAAAAGLGGRGGEDGCAEPLLESLAERLSHLGTEGAWQ